MKNEEYDIPRPATPASADSLREGDWIEWERPNNDDDGEDIDKTMFPPAPNTRRGWIHSVSASGVVVICPPTREEIEEDEPTGETMIFIMLSRESIRSRLLRVSTPLRGGES